MVERDSELPSVKVREGVPEGNVADAARVVVALRVDDAELDCVELWVRTRVWVLLNDGEPFECVASPE